MHTIKIGNQETQLQASMYTLVVYEQEFKEDLIKVLLLGTSYLDELRIAWALAVTNAAISKTPFLHFDEWVRQSTGELDLEEVSQAVHAECNEGFFCNTPVGDGE